MNTSEQHYDDIIVAIHGIGDQVRNATVRDVATRFARLPGLAKGVVFVAPQPLGYFHTEVTDAVKVLPLGGLTVPECPLSRLGFSEYRRKENLLDALDRRCVVQRPATIARNA